jgi:LPXTG-site transpeptidase (sortase) family protein
VSGRCPYIGLQGNRTQVYLIEDSRHRCYATGLPQRVGGAHQGTICLTSGYRRCPRFQAARAARVSQGPEEARELAWGDTGVAGGRKDLASDATATAPPRYTDLRPVPRRLWGSGRRRWLTRLEGTVLGLAACILCAILFVGYGILSRLQVGPELPLPAIARLVAPADSAKPTSVASMGPTSLPALGSTVEPSPGPSPASAQVVTSPQGLGEPIASPVPTVTTTAVATREAAPGHQPAPTVASPEPTLPPPTLEQAPSPEPTGTSEAPGHPPPATSPPTRLVLPAINLNVPVRPVKAKKVGQGANASMVWDELPNAAGFHDTSAYPGNPGNTVINGHRDTHAAIFRKLDQVQVGDEILLYVGPVAYAYRVAELLVVPETSATPAQKAENQRLIGYFPEERLTLITWTPVGLATHRLLVIARPSE